jgi:hypothetical protein
MQLPEKLPKRKKVRKRNRYNFEGPDVQKLEKRLAGLGAYEVLDYMDTTASIMCMQLAEIRQRRDPKEQAHLYAETKLTAQSLHVMADELLNRLEHHRPENPSPKKTRQIREHY